MARSLGRNARNRLWDGLGDGKSAQEYRQRERAQEKREWQKEELSPREVPLRQKRKKQNTHKKCERHKRITIEGNDCHWETSTYSWLQNVKVYVYYECQCRSVCVKCGDTRKKTKGRRYWGRDDCCHKEYKYETQPDKIGWVYLD